MPNNTRQQGVWIQTGNPETVDEVSPYAPGQLGSRVTVVQPGPRGGTPGAEENRPKTYQYIRTDSSMTVAPFKGAVAWWSDSANYLVTTSSTNRGRPAGVFANAITLGNYGFIQTKGPGTVKFIDAATAVPTAAGLIVIPSGTDGKADCLAAGTAATYPALGISVSAMDGGLSEAVVELDVPETVD